MEIEDRVEGLESLVLCSVLLLVGTAVDWLLVGIEESNDQCALRPGTLVFTAGVAVTAAVAHTAPVRGLWVRRREW